MRPFLRSIPAAIAALALLAPVAAFARHGDDRDDSMASIDGCEMHAPMTWGHRHDPRRARLEIVTEGGQVALVLTDDVIAMELTDHMMHHVDREMDRDRRDDEDDNAFANVIRDAVLSGVRSLLDHSLECPLDEIRDVRIRDDRLEIVTRDGDRVFQHVRVQGDPVLERFSPADQRAFVDAFHHLRDHHR